MTDPENPEWTAEDLRHAIPGTTWVRFRRGEFDGPADVVALRRFSKLTKPQFARALGVTPRTLHDWEAGRAAPEGPALAFLRAAARRPHILRDNLAPARSR